MRKATLPVLVLINESEEVEELLLDALPDCYLYHPQMFVYRASWSLDEYTHLSMPTFLYRPSHGCQWMAGNGGLV